jgi:hypothetical protein
MVTRVLLLWCLLLAGCTSVEVRHAEGMTAKSKVAQGKKVLLLEPQVTLTELLASGLEEPRPDWSENAKAHIVSSLQDVLSQSSASLVRYQEPEDLALKDRFRQLLLLQETVGQAAMFHGIYVKLANKHNRFDWSVGPGVRDLRAHFDADFALFTYVHDSYATAGRKALKAVGLLAAVVGVGVDVQTGSRVGYSTLIDLNDGKVVWSGYMVSQVGDLRELEDARKVTRDMFKGAPF